MNLETEVVQINLDEIIPNRFQPRLNFDDKALNDLAASIKEHGIIQPLVLRKAGDKYEIIAGERRYKAAGIAGLKTVPAIISNIDDNTSAEIAIVENVQRKDLTPIEEALSYKKLLDKDYLTQEQLAQKMGTSQSAIANKLRLLNLDEEVQKALLNEQISERHARSLLSLPDKETQKTMLQRILNERMTVRQLDSEIKNMIGDNVDSTEDSDIPLVQITPNVEDIKTNAVDLNPSVEQKNIDALLQPNQVATQQPEPQQPQPSNKFFNFLEDAPANMNMDEQPDPNKEDGLAGGPQFAPPIPPVAQEEIQPFANPSEASSEASTMFDSPLITPDVNPLPIANEPNPVAQEEIKPFSPEENPLPAAETPEILDFTNNIEKLDLGFAPSPPVQPQETSASPAPNPVEEVVISPFSNENIIDPVDLIGKEEPKTSNIPVDNDIGDAINDMRNSVKSLEEKGFYVETEEMDFEQMYQIIVKIQK